jgi:hypothetical protein
LGAVRGGHGPLLIDERGAARIAAPSPLEDPVVLERGDGGTSHNASLDTARHCPDTVRRGISPTALGAVAVEPWLGGGRAQQEDEREQRLTHRSARRSLPPKRALGREPPSELRGGKYGISFGAQLYARVRLTTCLLYRGRESAVCLTGATGAPAARRPQFSDRSADRMQSALRRGPPRPPPPPTPPASYRYPAPSGRSARAAPPPGRSSPATIYDGG